MREEKLASFAQFGSKKDSDKKLTGKKAGQILANNFPEFDNFTIRNELSKAENGWRASRTIKPTEKCKYHSFGKTQLLQKKTQNKRNKL